MLRARVRARTYNFLHALQIPHVLQTPRTPRILLSFPPSRSLPFPQYYPSGYRRRGAGLVLNHPIIQKTRYLRIHVNNT